MSYRAPVDDYDFLLDHVVGFDAVRATALYADASADVTHAVLREAGKMCEEVLAPLNTAGDRHPARLENGVVRCSPGFAEGYNAIASGGWVGITARPENGGMGLPMAIGTAVNEMISSACIALHLVPMMSQGQIEALEHHASDDLKARFLPKLISGEWNGTMNLTEPQAGSDVGALSTRAIDNGDGTYAITGQKIFISWGDSDIAENVCHLVLARLPGAPSGTKGISLFLVPKRIPDAQGAAGVANSLSVVSLEHKMGLHGSPTCVMQYDGATGWLVGAEGGGMAAMFTMMNNARLGVGAQGVGVAEAAFQHALAYATERKQGKTARDGGGTIVDHADVRRMLMSMKADAYAARAIALCLCRVALDMSTATEDRAWVARAAFLTPIAKSFGTDVGISVSQHRHSGARRHGLYRGNRCRAVFARCAGDSDLRGHQRHSGDGSGGAQDDGRGRGRLRLARRDRGAGRSIPHAFSQHGGVRVAGRRKPARGHGMDGRPNGCARAVCRCGPLSDGVGPCFGRAFASVLCVGGRKRRASRALGPFLHQAVVAGVRRVF